MIVLLVHRETRINLQSIMLIERRQIRTICCGIHLYKILEKAKLQSESKSTVARDQRLGVERDWRAKEKVWGKRNVLYLDFVGGYATVYICQHSKNYLLKLVSLMAGKLHLSKVGLKQSEKWGPLPTPFTNILGDIG